MLVGTQVIVYTWDDIQSEICKRLGISEDRFRDYAGKYTKEGIAEFEAKKDEWLDEHGYGNFKHVLDKPEGSDADWAKDSAEMQKRIEINTALRNVKSAWEIPYQDLWHEFLERVIPDSMRNGIIVKLWWYDEGYFDSEKYCPPVWAHPAFKVYNEIMKEISPDDSGVLVEFSW